MRVETRAWSFAMRLHSPACERNRDPILEVLRRVFPAEGLILEIASGTGMHAVHFGRGLPQVRWQPTDREEEHRASITAWIEDEGVRNVLPPLHLDVLEAWPVGSADAIFNANMIHISPWECTEALFFGGADVLRPGSPLLTYGPYRFADQPFAPSNARFDESLRARNPSWGIRDAEAIESVADRAGFELKEKIEMPANNHCLLFARNG